MIGRLSLTELIEKHQALENAIAEDRETFVSDWNGSHPFTKKYLGNGFVESISKSDLSRYIYFDEQPEILGAICSFHRQFEGISLTRNNILAGPGSSSILVAIALWLQQKGITEVFYVPPLYYTFHFFLRSLRVRLRPITGYHPFENNCRFNLPSKKTALLMTDPIWYAGRRFSDDQVENIATWQRRTNSYVLIDGSFQYMQWDGTRCELTSMLQLDRTFRLISPSKSLAIPAFRFAYLIHPAEVHDQLLFLYESIVGGANVSDLCFARRAMEALVSKCSNRELTDFLRATYNNLISRGIIRETITPDCGYFVFAEPNQCVSLAGQKAMTEEYFELRGYPNHVRFNLMTACRIANSNIHSTN